MTDALDHKFLMLGTGDERSRRTKIAARRYPVREGLPYRHNSIYSSEAAPRRGLK